VRHHSSIPAHSSPATPLPARRKATKSWNSYSPLEDVQVILQQSLANRSHRASYGGSPVNEWPTNLGKVRLSSLSPNPTITCASESNQELGLSVVLSPQGVQLILQQSWRTHPIDHRPNYGGSFMPCYSGDFPTWLIPLPGNRLQMSRVDHISRKCLNFLNWNASRSPTHYRLWTLRIQCRRVIGRFAAKPATPRPKIRTTISPPSASASG